MPPLNGDQLIKVIRGIYPMNTPAPNSGESLEDVVAFLCGEKPLEGLWYGSKLPERPTFWWRKNLRAALAHHDTTKRQALLEAVKANSHLDEYGEDFVFTNTMTQAIAEIYKETKWKN